MRVLEFLDGAAVRRWCSAAAEALGATEEQINALNVFPVADSDTGTNLHLTMLSAVRALDELPPSAGAREVWQALAHGVLLGAQGNSGVIVSQYLRGLAEICAHAAPCDGAAIRQGLAHAARLSRAAVGQPVEGTVLSVAAAGAESAATAGNALGAVARAAAQGARAALAQTTAQLDVLARAGVVDAGAAGLCLLLDALTQVVTGTAAGRYEVPARASRPAAGAGPVPGVPLIGATGYEVMYLLEAAGDNVTRLRDQLVRLGDSVVVVGGEGLWNVHVHVADAGPAIEAGIAAGRPYRIRVTYLGLAGPPQQPAGAGRPAAPDRGSAARPGHAVVAVAAGDGIAALFSEAGAAVVRHQDSQASLPTILMRAVREVGASTRPVVILPGSSHAAKIAETVAAQQGGDGADVAVVPTLAAVQSLSALAVHDPARAFDADVTAMADAAALTRWGHVTWVATGQAVGEAAGCIGADAVTFGGDAAKAAVSVTERLLADGGELITLLAGSLGGPGAPAGAELAADVAARLMASRPDLEIISHQGGEPEYLLQIGVE